MQNYNAKDKFIMKGDMALGHSRGGAKSALLGVLGGASRGVRGVRRSRSRRGGWWCEKGGKDVCDDVNIPLEF